MGISTLVDKIVGGRWAERITRELNLKPNQCTLIYIRSNPAPAFLPESSPGFSIRAVSEAGKSSGMYFSRGSLLGILPDELFYNYCKWRADKLADALEKKSIGVEKKYPPQFNQYL